MAVYPVSLRGQRHGSFPPCYCSMLLYDSTSRALSCERCGHSWAYRGSKALRPSKRLRRIDSKYVIPAEATRAWLAGVLETCEISLQSCAHKGERRYHRPRIRASTGSKEAAHRVISAIGSGAVGASRTGKYRISIVWQGAPVFLQIFETINPYITNHTREKFNAVIKQYQDAQEQ